MQLNVTVTLTNAEPVTVPVLNPDRVRWDMTAAKHSWPEFAKAPFLGTTFLAWAAMRREGLYTDSFENFRDRDALEIESSSDNADDPDAVGDLGRPTP